MAKGVREGVMGMCGRIEDKIFVVGGEFPAPFFAFFLFLPRNGHFCAHVCQKRHGDIAHKPVCVRGKGKGEGGGCQNKKML